jgi:hypothetical protein
MVSRFAHGGVGALLLCALCAAPARAQTSGDKETARLLMDQGHAAMTSRDFEKALHAFEAADKIMHVPTTGLAVAKARLALGHLIEARDVSLAVARLPIEPGEHPVFGEARTEAAALAKSIAPRIPSLSVTIEGGNSAPGLVVHIDEVRIRPGAPRELNPGKHVVTAWAPNHRRARTELSLAEGARESASLTLEPESAAGRTPDAAPEADARATGGTSPLVYVGFGVGAAGIAVGSVAGLLSLSKTSSVEDQCNGTRCPRSAEDDADSAKALANVSNVGFAVGLVGIGVGVYGLLSSEPSEVARARSAGSIEPVIGTRFLGVRGSLP